MTKLIRSFVADSVEEENVLKDLLRLDQIGTNVSVQFNYQIKDSYFNDGTWYRAEDSYQMFDSIADAIEELLVRRANRKELITDLSGECE